MLLKHPVELLGGYVANHIKVSNFPNITFLVLAFTYYAQQVSALQQFETSHEYV